LFQDDAETVELYGQLVIWCTTVTPTPFIPVCPGDPILEFSLDIGSDAELSDRNHNGNEWLDPGDSYLWHAPLFPGPANGFRNDAGTFGGLDPAPRPTLPHDEAPTCSGFDPVAVRNLYYDMDDEDSI